MGTIIAWAPDRRLGADPFSVVAFRNPRCRDISSPCVHRTTCVPWFIDVQEVGWCGFGKPSGISPPVVVTEDDYLSSVSHDVGASRGFDENVLDPHDLLSRPEYLSHKETFAFQGLW
jgi:hypothetical protein